ncbi:MAG TPA: 16S rRNA (cytosine(1402)-N(4))-methyltransferase RsmH [Actinomycetota bacterium]|nr:16S rRNA (cytosine(1402)-N(4))-methyltransferase RsmH [Actinomycetota bacterium]
MLVRTGRSPAARVMPRDRQRRPDGRPVIDLRPGQRPSERRPLVTDGHVPVMVEEVLRYLGPQQGGLYVDCTLGAGGHSEAILRAAGGRCTLLGIDRDPGALARAGQNLAPFGDSVRLVSASFADLEWVLHSQGVAWADGILLDLGMSSMQVDDPARGFSFRQDGPLDMRMDPQAPLTAAEIVNSYPPQDLERILWSFGEERLARRLARAIVDARRKAPLRTTGELARVIESAYPAAVRRHGHPARKTFQALRIEVNGELEALQRVLASVPSVLAPGGRIVVLSYHSLEDRMVKQAFAGMSGGPVPLPGLPPSYEGAILRLLTRSAVMPSEAEVERNPRASSARLRAAVRDTGETQD